MHRGFEENVFPSHTRKKPCLATGWDTVKLLSVLWDAWAAPVEITQPRGSGRYN